ncbi:MAG: hypothetical protein JWQ66_3764 [Mucilaginibacter sp.]|nr:hypothetical protein [Mucilaginibacter sp.]
MDFYLLLVANLQIGDVVYVTGQGTSYFFQGWTPDGSLKYNINNDYKYIPMQTIIGCKQASVLEIFGTNWFMNNYPTEYQSRPCNFKVMEKLIVDYPVI